MKTFNNNFWVCQNIWYSLYYRVSFDICRPVHELKCYWRPANQANRTFQFIIFGVIGKSFLYYKIQTSVNSIKTYEMRESILLPSIHITHLSFFYPKIANLLALNVETGICVSSRIQRMVIRYTTKSINCVFIEKYFYKRMR